MENTTTPSATSQAHTPGPWIITEGYGTYPGVDAGGQNIILNSDLGEYCGVRGESHDEALANARLIAAVPDLLEFAKSARNAFEERLSCLRDERIHMADAVGNDECGDIDDQIGNYECLLNAANSVITKAEHAQAN